MEVKQPLFRTARLSVTYGGLAALTDLDLEIREHEIVGLIGPNGAGKTTAFNAITGVVKPSSGRVLFLGEDITGWRAPRIAAKGIARTFQNIRLYDDMTVIENVMAAGHSLIRYSFLEAVVGLIEGKAAGLLEVMGLIEMAGDKASSLPYGSQRKLEIARALALDPALLLLDEPVAGMNPMETLEFGELLSKIHSDLGLTIGLIDHDMRFVMNVCHKIKVIDHGVQIAWGSPREIRDDEKVIAAYLGESA
ncbi:MAG: ABC transporter ATP-binding protein [Deltaproteobacteria bacterium]